MRSELALTSTAELVTTGTVRTRVTIVVPCFNEEPTLSYLRDRIYSLRQLLEKRYEIYLLLADDGSTDNTWHTMGQLFESAPNCTLFRQPKNLGVAATILAGIRRARTEIVCSIDCDCSYDPDELGRLLPMLTPGIDLVTASPYHPLGTVLDVPRWRLLLSKTVSRLYRHVLRRKLHTYTSCFRVYRRSAILKLDLRRNGFLGIAELIGKLDLKGSVIVECPTRLEARVRGESKMKVIQVLLGHLYLLSQLLAARGLQRILGRRPAESEPTKLQERSGATADWAR